MNLQWAAMVAALLVAGIPAKANTVYYDATGTGGLAQLPADSSYWSSAASCNGYNVTTTSSTGVCGGAFSNSYSPGDTTTASYAITAGVGGAGSFLFNGTYGYNSGSDAFYISPSFTVQPNTEYTVSFYLTNADSAYGNEAQVEAVLGGDKLGTVTANGFYTDGSASDQWQLETLFWNSGATSGTLALTLNDLTTSGAGNDFGIEGVSVQTACIPTNPGGCLNVIGIGGTAAPEPATYVLSGFGLMLVGIVRRKKRQCRAANSGAGEALPSTPCGGV